MDTEKIRKDFPIFKRKINGKPLIYLDNAATTQKPKKVIDAVTEFYETCNSNVHRGMNTLSREATDIYEQAHEKTANLLKAKGIEEIIFTKNTTESLNLLAYSLENKVEKGDEIVLTKMEHHANIVPWQQLAKRKKLTLKFAELAEDLTLDLNHLESLITDKTKIVSVTAASNVLGTVNDTAQISEMAKRKGAIFIVDAAQAIPHRKISAKKTGADFIAFSAHKMLGPTGVGVLYGKEEMLGEMPPFLTGGDMISTVTTKKAEWNTLPWKFEAGTPNIAGAAGFTAAIEYLERIGFEEIQKHGTKIMNYAAKRINEIKGVETYIPGKGDKTGVLPFNVEGIHPHDVSEILNDEGIMIRAGNHCAQPLLREMGVENISRASFYMYNNEKEIDKLAAGIEKAKKVFGV